MVAIQQRLAPFVDRAKNPERLLVVLALVPGLVLGLAMVRMDVGEPVTFAIALIDGLLTVAVIASCVGLFVAWLAPTPVAARVVVAVAATGLATAFTVLAQRDPGPAYGGVAVWAIVAATLSLVTGSWVVWRCRSIFQALWKGTLVAGLLALVLPLAQFWHQTTWDSTVAKASLGLAPTIEVQGRDGDRLLVNVHLDLSNGSPGRVRIIHSSVDVCHWAPGARDITYEADELRDRKGCVRWTAFSPRSWLDGGVGLEASKVFAVPRDDPHVVVLARIAYARGDRLQLSSTPVASLDSAPDEKGPDGRCEDAAFYRVADDSHGRDLAQSDKYLGYADRKGYGGTAYFLISGDPDECRDNEQALIDYYGVTELSTVAEDWLVPGSGSPTTPHA